MRSSALSVLSCCALLLSVAFPAAAEEMILHAGDFPQNTAVRFDLAGTKRAPRAELEAKVTYREGQARIEIEFSDLKPAVLFGGNVTCYVLWAVTPDGFAKNLGEFLTDDGRGENPFFTGLKSFALLMTAEAYFDVRKPSELSVFFGRPPEKGKTPFSSFAFSAFDDAPDHDLESIATVSWDSDQPVELVKAERAFAHAENLDAQEYAPNVMDDARLTLAQARNMISSARRRDDGLEFASRAFALSSNAIGVAVRKIEAERLEAEIAERSATIDDLEERASEAEEQLAEAREQTTRLSQERRRLESELAALRTERTALEAALDSLRRDKAQLAREKADLAQEKEQLTDRLQSALSEVAETRSSARGTIVSLPDILFDLNESTLKPEARLVLAKLAGILLIMDDLNLRIEGHTDSTGSREYNQQLSEARAGSVRDFLLEQGVAVRRMVAVGYGPDRPVASNATAEGRRQNRRVEIVIAEGEVAEADDER